MPADGSTYLRQIAEPAPDAWATSADLTEDQRARFGGYVAAKDEARLGFAATRASRERSEAALTATHGDKLSALALLLAGDR